LLLPPLAYQAPDRVEQVRNEYLLIKIPRLRWRFQKCQGFWNGISINSRFELISLICRTGCE
jgi:hypothetical protein